MQIENGKRGYLQVTVGCARLNHYVNPVEEFGKLMNRGLEAPTDQRLQHWPLYCKASRKAKHSRGSGLVIHESTSFKPSGCNSWHSLLGK
jgi:hypothetical protein